MSNQPVYGTQFVPGFGWGAAVKPLDSAEGTGTPTPSAFNPWYAKVADPTFVTASIVVPSMNYTSPPMQVADIPTVLGQNLDRLINYSGAALVPPLAISVVVDTYLTMYPSLDTPQARMEAQLADHLLAMGRAANPSIKQ